jgi:hypothetical protein
MIVTAPRRRGLFSGGSVNGGGQPSAVLPPAKEIRRNSMTLRAVIAGVTNRIALDTLMSERGSKG